MAGRGPLSKNGKAILECGLRGAAKQGGGRVKTNT
jgi:hypothetical protein